MMNMTSDIKHHLNEELLMAYAAGSLPEAFNLMVATHVSLCDECRARVESYDALGGAVIEADADRVEMGCLLYTSPSPRDQRGARMPSSA